jgi:hypothetical protein
MQLIMPAVRTDEICSMPDPGFMKPAQVGLFSFALTYLVRHW